MIIWTLVESGSISEWRTSRPAGGWRNVSNIEALDDGELSEMGWKPVVVTEDEIGPEQVAGGIEISIDEEGVVTARSPAIASPVPVTVPNANLRVALRELGLLAQIKAAALADKAAHNAIDPTDDGEFWERWEYGNFIGRHDAFVLQMQAAFEKTDADMDAIFRLAETK